MTGLRDMVDWIGLSLELSGRNGSAVCQTTSPRIKNIYFTSFLSRSEMLTGCPPAFEGRTSGESTLNVRTTAVEPAAVALSRSSASIRSNPNRCPLVSSTSTIPSILLLEAMT